MGNQLEPSPLLATESPVAEFAGTLGAFSAANLGALRTSLPPQFTLRWRTLGMGFYLSYGYLVVVIMAGCAAMAGHHATTALVLFMGMPIFGKVERARVTAPRNLLRARSLLRAAKRDVPAARDATVVLNRDAAAQISVSLPEIAAQWASPRNLSEASPLHVLLDGEQLLCEPLAMPTKPWGQQWLDALPQLTMQAQASGIDVEAAMLELITALDGSHIHSTDSAMLLRVLRQRCDDASRLYLGLEPQQAASCVMSGRSATNEYIDLLDVLLTCARMLRESEALTFTQERTLLRTLEDHAFTHEAPKRE